MGERRRRDQSAQQTAVVLIRGVLEDPVALDELADKRVVARATVVVDGTPLDIVAFNRPARALSVLLPGSPVALVGALRISRKDRPDNRNTQVLTVEIQRVKSTGPSTNHRPFVGRS